MNGIHIVSAQIIIIHFICIYMSFNYDKFRQAAASHTACTKNFLGNVILAIHAHYVICIIYSDVYSRSEYSIYYISCACSTHTHKNVLFNVLHFSCYCTLHTQPILNGSLLNHDHWLDWLIMTTRTYCRVKIPTSFRIGSGKQRHSYAALWHASTPSDGYFVVNARQPACQTSKCIELILTADLLFRLTTKYGMPIVCIVHGLYGCFFRDIVYNVLWTNPPNKYP